MTHRKFSINTIFNIITITACFLHRVLEVIHIQRQEEQGSELTYPWFHGINHPVSNGARGFRAPSLSGAADAHLLPESWSRDCNRAWLREHPQETLSHPPASIPIPIPRQFCPLASHLVDMWRFSSSRPLGSI